MATTDWTDACDFEACVNELDECVASMQPFPEVVLAQALRAHLAALLHALLTQRVCTAEQIREFVSALERESLRRIDSTG